MAAKKSFPLLSERFSCSLCATIATSAFKVAFSNFFDAHNFRMSQFLSHRAAQFD